MKRGWSVPVPPIDMHRPETYVRSPMEQDAFERTVANNALGGYTSGKTTLRDYTSAERKEMPVQTVMAEYFPDALAAVARQSKKASGKHNPGEPMHWARNKSTDHLNCAARHLMTPDSVDPDTKEIELVGAAWRCLAALQLREEKRLVAAGIKPLSGVIER